MKNSYFILAFFLLTFLPLIYPLILCELLFFNDVSYIFLLKNKDKYSIINVDIEKN